MSKNKQANINSFFQPKAKDYALSSTPLRIKPRSFLKSRNNRNFNNNLNKPSSNVVISLLSSDEEDEITSGNEKRSDDQNNPSVNSPKIELNLENDDTNQASANTSLNDKSDGFLATADFLDVILQEENGSSDVKQEQLQEEFTDYKWSSFSSMINWVLNDKSNYHLFNEDDWNVIENFKSMSGKRLLKKICQIIFMSAL